MNIAKHNQMFGFHPATKDTRPKHEEIREAFIKFADKITDIIPEGREAALMITHLQTAAMFANAAVALSAPLEA